MRGGAGRAGEQFDDHKGWVGVHVRASLGNLEKYLRWGIGHRRKKGTVGADLSGGLGRKRWEASTG